MSSEEISDIKKTLEKLTESMKRIEEKLDNSVTEIKKNFADELKTCKDGLRAAENRTIEMQDAIDMLAEAHSRNHQLRVSNVPRRENESLNKIVDNLKSSVGINPEDIKTYSYRLKAGKSKDTIIVKFGNILEKEKFFSNYLKGAKNLKASKIVRECKKDERIYVTQDLGVCQFKLQQYAKKMKKEGHIKDTRISDGIVTVQTRDNEKFQRIFFASQLDKLIAERARDKASQKK